MRLPEGIKLDTSKTFGKLLFSAQRRERFIEDDEGNQTTNVRSRTFDLKSTVQGQMVQVSIPAEAGTKNFEYDQEVALVDPEIDTVANADFRGVTVSWYLKATDIVPVKNSQSKTSPVTTEKNSNDKK
ncbi:YdcP family protein [Loigolactobacillus binensis]|uniref:YdcP family protein n=1 Tax=Loigolactobacillus binensis TaxID=2559922 RepID=A0ABW3E8P9_9LACO|nr:YdcP family protein [Loigolactobacillus binensis]